MKIEDCTSISETTLYTHPLSLFFPEHGSINLSIHDIDNYKYLKEGIDGHIFSECSSHNICPFLDKMEHTLLMVQHELKPFVL